MLSVILTVYRYTSAKRLLVGVEVYNGYQALIYDQSRTDIKSD